MMNNTSICSFTSECKSVAHHVVPVHSTRTSTVLTLKKNTDIKQNVQSTAEYFYHDVDSLHCRGDRKDTVVLVASLPFHFKVR